MKGFRFAHFFSFVFLLFLFVVAFVFLPKKVNAASTLVSSSVTMSNSRMSFKAPISSGAAGSSLITISGSVPDTTTRHLFPGDTVCFTDEGNNVCRDNTTYTVVSTPSDTTFNISTPLTTALTGTDYAVASQSGTWTITFTTVNAVPVGGKLIITIPANDANSTSENNNGMPDSDASVSVNGFDMNQLAVADATVTAGCTPANWGTAGVATSITPGGGGTTDTTIIWNRATSSCTGGTTITVSIAGNGIVNPAPITGHTQGAADIYGITLATTDGTNTIDTSIPKVAPVEAVLISGTVDETLSFVVTGLAGGAQTYCGSYTYIDTSNNYSTIPWGHFAATDTFYYAAQNLVVSTNAVSGYAVTLSESDQMGKNGNECTGTAPSSGEYTFSSATCIRDTVCSAATPCTESVMGDWPTASGYSGLGYTLATTGGSTAAVFFYNEGSRTFNAKQLADIQGGESAQTIMSSEGPVNADGIDVCYKISITGLQPAGYYYNIAKYTATATF